jgi:uncharacterized protein YjbI with pentapeptide repeats
MNIVYSMQTSWISIRRVSAWISFALRYKFAHEGNIWATSWQNQHNGFAASMDPDQPARPRSLISIYAVRLPTLLQVEKLTANSMDPDQMRGCAGWSGSMLVANPLNDTAHCTCAILEFRLCNLHECQFSHAVFVNNFRPCFPRQYNFAFTNFTSPTLSSNL